MVGGIGRAGCERVVRSDHSSLIIPFPEEVVGGYAPCPPCLFAMHTDESEVLSYTYCEVDTPPRAPRHKAKTHSPSKHSRYISETHLNASPTFTTNA